jgi:hypothetical protein
MAEKKTDRGIPGEERFIATGKSVILIKPGKGVARAQAKPQAKAKKGKK